MSHLDKVREIKTSWPSPDFHGVEYISWQNAMKKCAKIVKGADREIEQLRADLLRVVEIAREAQEQVINEYHSNYFSQGTPYQRHIDEMNRLSDEFKTITEIENKYKETP